MNGKSDRWFLACLSMLQSLMIAAIPNIIGWLAISFAKVSMSGLVLILRLAPFICVNH